MNPERIWASNGWNRTHPRRPGPGLRLLVYAFALYGALNATWRLFQAII
jgi:hypothetical protein